ncbi:MAG: phosphoribosylformylglycinamidine synthase II, partial [Chloroflexi bacterium]|nr:phosphoribosylformylglycinamidine synthase II [Chloroflexota bacterium]
LPGAASLDAAAASLAGSEYLAHVHGLVIGAPSIDLALEARLQTLLGALADDRALRSAHDCSDGGLAVAVAESAILGGVGLVGEASLASGRWDAALFGEAPSRVVVSCAADKAGLVLGHATTHGVPALRLGTVGGDRVRLGGLIDEPLDALAEAHGTGLEQALAG